MLARNEQAIVAEYQEYSATPPPGTESPVKFESGHGGDHMSEQSKLNAYQQSESYTRVPQPGIPTYTEAWSLIEAARRMASASDFAKADNIKDRNKVRDAIRLNWRLWTIFQAEMTIDENDIPDEIRLNMLTLCKFVDEHTIETLKSPVPEKIATLIEINRNIAAGLLDSLKTQDGETDDSATTSTDSAQEDRLTSLARNA